MKRSIQPWAEIGAATVTLLLMSCKKMDSMKTSLHGIEYEFPSNQIAASVLPPEGRIFVRLAPPGTSFHLILDEFNPYIPNKLGDGIPTISRINDNRFGNFTVIQSSSGHIICDNDPQPHFDCGLEVQDGPVKWSVLFDREQVSQSAEIRAKATSLIESYRSAHAEHR